MEKRTFLHCFSGEYRQAMSHASVPCAVSLNGGLFRVFLSSRDEDNRSFPSYIDVDLGGEYPEVKGISRAPVMELGKRGTFDDGGVMPTWIMRKGGDLWMYYIGWNLGVSVPFRNSLGLAISHDNGDSFTRMFEGPILDRTKDEPHFVASASVLDMQEYFTMVYLSCTEWHTTDDGKIMHKYHLKQTNSVDGISWERPGNVAIDYSDKNEYAISRPSIIRIGEKYHMWFTYRGEAYKIGYAKSDDCHLWERDDSKSGIGPSKEGWDSNEVAYPNVVSHGDRYFMFYNGDNYGKTGVGVGELSLDL